jgi:hypothetical protein
MKRFRLRIPHVHDTGAVTSNDEGAEMMSSGDEPVVSGGEYLVTEVDGRVPVDLVDFDGEVRMTLALGETPLGLVGVGTVGDGSVRFLQKSPGPDDKDVRVWTITESADRRYLAQPIAIF